jgi:hypothetical protein
VLVELLSFGQLVVLALDGGLLFGRLLAEEILGAPMRLLDPLHELRLLRL